METDADKVYLHVHLHLYVEPEPTPVFSRHIAWTLDKLFGMKMDFFNH